MARQQRSRRRAATGVVLLALVASASACTGDGDDAANSADNTTSSGSTAPSAGDPDAVIVTGRLGRTVGDMNKKTRNGVLDGVLPVVDAWIESAYGGEYPRTDFDGAFDGFTAGAVKQADGALDILTNADIGGQVDGVTFTRRNVVVDTVGRGNDPAGATARVNLEFTTTGDVESTVAVKGRLMLSPVKQGWKIFGFDVRKGAR